MWKKRGNPEQVSMSVSLVQLLKKKKMKVLGFLLLFLFFLSSSSITQFSLCSLVFCAPSGTCFLLHKNLDRSNAV